jgi:hypothetical protein
MKNKLQKCRFSILKSITAKLFLTFAIFIYGQQVFAQFVDDFSDGDFVNDPKWFGADSMFTIDSGQLRLNAPAGSEIAYLATACKSINDANWEFLIKLDFNPSASNFARIYLVSDQADLSNPLNGYFVGIGNTTDDVSLYVQSSTTSEKIIDGVDGVLNTPGLHLRVKVTRDRDGTWELLRDVDNVGAYVSEGRTPDQQHLNSEFFGILCSYTSSRSDKFYFDNIAVAGDQSQTDTLPETGPNAFKDVIFTEVFPDPTPMISLPDAEFVEIFNRSEHPLNLNGWSLSDGSSTATLSEAVLLPSEYLILTSDPSLFPTHLKVLGVSRFPSLNNSEDHLILRDANDIKIDSVHYSIDWYRSDRKNEGGWSLELIDPENECAEAENWVASEDAAGGTPGVQNSVFANKPDIAAPSLVSAIPVSPTRILLMFNEKLQSEIPSLLCFTIEPLIELKSVSFNGPALRELIIELDKDLARSHLYALTVKSITDCAGNVIDEAYNKMTFGLPEEPLPGDVLINEILFDPPPLGVDFVEIVNASDKYFNLKNWTIGNFANDTLTNMTDLCPNDLLLPPGGMIALTEDIDVLKGHYPLSDEKNMLQIDDLPPLNDDKGSIAVATGNGMLLDHLVYSNEMHSVFIKDPEGISLERITVELATNDIQNWKSASTASAYATPGYINSNSRGELINHPGTIQVEPEVFIPMYGQPDFVMVHYEFDHGGFVGNVKVLDAQGHLVKQLMNNEILGTQGSLRWDGDRTDGMKASVGYYMISFEVFDDRGEVRTSFGRVAVATRF